MTQRIEVLVGVGVLALLIGEGWVLVQVMAQRCRVLRRLAEAGLAVPLAAVGTAGLPVGTLAPSFALPTLTGETTTLPALRALGKPVVLLFSDPGCGPCTQRLGAGSATLRRK